MSPPWPKPDAKRTLELRGFKLSSCCGKPLRESPKGMRCGSCGQLQPGAQ